MRRRSLLWHIFPPFLVIIVLTMLLVTGLSFRALRRHQIEGVGTDLEARARLLSALIQPLAAELNWSKVQDLCLDLGRATDTRFTIILPDGEVVGDSEEDPARMENHADRPEIGTALSGAVGRSERFSGTLRHGRLYVAIPGPAADAEGIESGYVVRASISLSAINAALRDAYWQMAFGGLVLAVLAAGVSFLVSRRISVPLRKLQRGAERFASGQLNTRLAAPDNEEIGALADAMNRMAEHLHERIATIEKQRNELESVLSSMVEGVLAIDTDETVLGLNGAGARLLGLDPESVLGRSVQEVVRNPDLLTLTQQALESGEAVEGDIVLSREKESFLQVHATGLKGPGDERLGALLVLNDVTRLRRLENIRRDFVANVSHELRTPITSIKGFVETLLESPPENRDDAQRFLEIVHKQSERLNAIIDDLLSLSRIEQEADEATISFGEARVADVLAAAIAACSTKIEKHPGRITLDCEDDLVALINSPLIEQAVVNLVENALKYSEPDTAVRVAAGRENGAILISVEDRGRGIDPKHIPRLFERFYRVDKARSRKLGGTGLGLAIVKHIVQAHAGEVRVESEPGKGSLFTIVLPHSGVGGTRTGG